MLVTVFPPNKRLPDILHSFERPQVYPVTVPCRLVAKPKRVLPS